MNIFFSKKRARFLLILSTIFFIQLQKTNSNNKQTKIITQNFTCNNETFLIKTLLLQIKQMIPQIKFQKDNCENKEENLKIFQEILEIIEMLKKIILNEIKSLNNNDHQPYNDYNEINELQAYNNNTAMLNQALGITALLLQGIF